MKNYLNNFNYIWWQSWSLILFFNLLFFYYYDINIFSILILNFISLFMITNVSNTVNQTVKKIKTRDLTTIFSFEKPRNKNTYKGHPRQHNAFKNLEGDLIVVETSIISSETTKNKQNIYIGEFEGDQAFLVISKLKVLVLKSEEDKKFYLTEFRKENYAYKLKEPVSNEKITEAILDVLKQNGYQVENQPITNWTVSLDDYLIAIQNVKLGKQIMEIIKD